ncbi:MAG: DUF3306 domain-containing protein [Betaproteobacteria bacterium]|nr:DUF3306 domain-containing protein [Betaproteobacteria bacterium]
MTEKNFLSRWSRKKAGLTEETASTQSTPPIAKVSTPMPLSKNEATEANQPAADHDQKQPPPPTLEDVEKIDVKAPDFSAFMRPDVDPLVQQAALKKMFSDPHFNVMDGLDIYIDDYTKSDPIPLDMLKRMQQSELLGLFKSAEELYPDSTQKTEPEITPIEDSPEKLAASSYTVESAESNPAKPTPVDQKSATQPIEIESEATSPRAPETIPIGERQAKRNSDQTDS